MYEEQDVCDNLNQITCLKRQKITFLGIVAIVFIIFYGILLVSTIQQFV